MHIFYDIGGTNTRIGYSKDGKVLESNIMFETLPSFDDGFKLLVSNTLELVEADKIMSICAGVPGTLNKEKDTLLHAPHLTSWEGVNIVSKLNEVFGCPVHIENDSALVGLGEAVFGAGKGHNIVAYITLSTGVGGVKIENSRIDSNSIGFEIGHHFLDGEKTFENLVSGTAIEEKYGMKPKEIIDVNIWEDYTDTVAKGVANAITFWSPDVVVIGGSMARSVLFDRLNDKVRGLCPEYDQIPSVVKADLDTVGGLYGGLATVLNK
jgi:predicted NBD/HSP70 family sugar kinase